MQSLGALSHISYKEPAMCSYELAAQYMMEIGLTAKEIEQFYRRMVFNCIAVNQDDHVKNTSFLMDRNGIWSLAPAYDITFSYNPDNKWLRAHQMTVNGKTTGIIFDDLLAAGAVMSLSRRKCKGIIEQIQSIVDRFEEFASPEGLKEEAASEIRKVLNDNKVI